MGPINLESTIWICIIVLALSFVFMKDKEETAARKAEEEKAKAEEEEREQAEARVNEMVAIFEQRQSWLEANYSPDAVYISAGVFPPLTFAADTEKRVVIINEEEIPFDDVIGAELLTEERRTLKGAADDVEGVVLYLSDIKNPSVTLCGDQVFNRNVYATALAVIDSNKEPEKA